MNVSIIVPMRNRDYMKPYFEQNVKQYYSNYNYEIIYVYQDDDEPFKVAQLRCIGCLHAQSDFLIYRDIDVIDLTPFNFIEEYDRFNGPYRAYNKRQNLKIQDDGTFIKFENEHDVIGYGGYVIMKKEDFNKHNGFTNLCIGWGIEDMIIKNVYDLQTLSRTFGHIWHPSNENQEKDHTNINKEIYNLYITHQIDPQLDGAQQLKYNVIKEILNNNIREIHVNNISVCDNFTYMNLYKKHFK